MSVSEVQICNLALLKFGDITISSITNPTNKEERSCKVLYPLMRDLMLFSYPWNFAMTRADISAKISTAPAFQWDYSYTIPVDCLRVWQLYSTDDDWQVEGNELLTNKDSEIYIRYIKKIETSGTFSMGFVNCLALKLAAELAAKISGDAKKRLSLIEELERIELPRAYKLNAIEGKRMLEKGEQGLDKGNYSWQSHGHSGEDIEDQVFSS